MNTRRPIEPIRIRRPLGKTGLEVPPIIFGTSCLGNLYQALPLETKREIVAEWFRWVAPPVVLDTAGKYGAGLALETMGRLLRELQIPPEDVLISNKLGWKRVPLQGAEPTFEPGAWVDIEHDAVQAISYDGILECHRQGVELLGSAYAPRIVSVHDPDEYLLAAVDAANRRRRMQDITEAYAALHELKSTGEVKAVGVGAKDWTVIREIAEAVELDWVMLACSLTVHTHSQELIDFVQELRRRGVAVINSAVFNAGFLVGGTWFDYRRPDPESEPQLFEWRSRFLARCQEHGVSPAFACVQFGMGVPGVVATALNTSRPDRVRENVESVTATISPDFWSALHADGLIASDLPFSG